VICEIYEQQREPDEPRNDDSRGCRLARLTETGRSKSHPKAHHLQVSLCGQTCLETQACCNVVSAMLASNRRSRHRRPIVDRNRTHRAERLPNESRKTASPIDTISGSRSLTPPNLEERARHFLDKLLEEGELGARELWNQERGESSGSHSKPYETCQRLARGNSRQRPNSP
jgi:hypothetical protein